MTITTTATRMLGITHPILLAPMGGVAGGALAAAVTAAGGLGIIGGGYGDPKAGYGGRNFMEEQFRAAGNARIGIGYITWALARSPDLLDQALERKPVAFFLSFGDEMQFARKVKDSGALLICQVQDVEGARRAVAAGKLLDGKAAAAEVSLRLEDGTTYGQKGKLELTDVTVDQSTGAVTLRAVFPNPDGVLLPGMYVRAIVAEGVANGVILAPQQGVSRNEKGEPTAFVVDADGKAQLRVLKTDRVIGDRWLVSSGLGDGDRLIVEGLLKVHPGAQVNAVPAGSPPKDQAAPSGPKG